MYACNRDSTASWAGCGGVLCDPPDEDAAAGLSCFDRGRLTSFPTFWLPPQAHSHFKSNVATRLYAVAWHKDERSHLSRMGGPAPTNLPSCVDSVWNLLSCGGLYPPYILG